MTKNIKRFFRFVACTPCAVFLLGAAVVAPLWPAQAKLATVGAVHDYVREKWDVEIPHNYATSNLPNMHYLMQVVDAANLALNKMPTSDYANDIKYATSALVATTAARDAVDTLIKKVEWHFFFTPAGTTNEYYFYIAAIGTFYVDWGDGTREIVQRTKATSAPVSHTFDGPAKNYEIALGGKATKYGSSGVISFKNAASRLSAIRGCLGCVFSTSDNEKLLWTERQPSFSMAFEDNSALTEIPADLFQGVYGPPRVYMFDATFQNCTSLSGPIPAKLFSGLYGEPTTWSFAKTFSNCGNLSGDIPADLFKNLTAPTVYPDLAFGITFNKCSRLTGYSPKIGGRYLYEIWPEVSSHSTYTGATKLSDYTCIPTNWGGGGTKQPGECEPPTPTGAAVQ